MTGNWVGVVGSRPKWHRDGVRQRGLALCLVSHPMTWKWSGLQAPGHDGKEKVHGAIPCFAAHNVEVVGVVGSRSISFRRGAAKGSRAVSCFAAGDMEVDGVTTIQVNIIQNRSAAKPRGHAPPLQKALRWKLMGLHGNVVQKSCLVKRLCVVSTSKTKYIEKQGPGQHLD